MEGKSGEKTERTKVNFYVMMRKTDKSSKSFFSTLIAMVVATSAGVILSCNGEKKEKEGKTAGEAEKTVAVSKSTSPHSGLKLLLNSPEPVEIGRKIRMWGFPLNSSKIENQDLTLTIESLSETDRIKGSSIIISPSISIHRKAGQNYILLVEYQFHLDALPGGISSRALGGASQKDGSISPLPSVIVPGKNLLYFTAGADDRKIVIFANPLNSTPFASIEEGISEIVSLFIKIKAEDSLSAIVQRCAGELEIRLMAQSILKEVAHKTSLDKPHLFYTGKVEGKVSIEEGEKFLLRKIKIPSELKKIFPSKFLIFNKEGQILNDPQQLAKVVAIQRLKQIFDEDTKVKFLELLSQTQRSIDQIVAECNTAKDGRANEECSPDRLKQITEAHQIVKMMNSLLRREAPVDSTKFIQLILSIITAKILHGKNTLEPVKEPLLEILRTFEKSSRKTTASCGKEVCPNEAFLRCAVDGLVSFSQKSSVVSEKITEKIYKILSINNGVSARVKKPTHLFPMTSRNLLQTFLSAVELKKTLVFSRLLPEIKFQPAPSPETKIEKWTVKKDRMTVKLSGKDEDGRVTAFKYWIDKWRVSVTIKKSHSAKINLSTLRSGMHKFYASAIDDDEQEDKTPASFSFYLKRYVELKVKSVDSTFDAPPQSINSEHHRSAIMYSREIEEEVQKCGDEYFRFGIDGRGKVRVKIAFKGGKSYSVPLKREIVLDSLKNKKLSRCVKKALKAGRLRYNQPFQPPAVVSITFEFKPQILFFDAEKIGSTPGGDAVGAVRFLKCISKKPKKIQSFCTNAAEMLNHPPSDEEITGEVTESPEEPNKTGQNKAVESTESTPEAQSPIKPISYEFDPMKVKSDCIRKSTEYLISKCSAGLTKKRLWCVDSCRGKTKGCERNCKREEVEGEDVPSCIEECWIEFMLPCATHCAVRNTPFEKQE